MTLNRDDFPDLTDEQWDKIVAENDRRATEASKTAKRGLVAQADVDARIAEAIERERERLEMDEKQRLEADRKALEDREKAFAAERKTFTAKNRLLDSGIPADKVDALLPIFTGVDDKTLSASLDTFVNTWQEAVKGKVDAEKETLLGNATPPDQSTTAPVDLTSAAVEDLKQGNEAGAVDKLLQSAGYTE